MLTSLLQLPKDSLQGLGIINGTGLIHYQLSPEELVQDSLRLGEGFLNDSGALMVKTGRFTGRSPRDKYIVREDGSQHHIHWNEFNQPITENHFREALKQVSKYLNGKKELWVRDSLACADPRYRIRIRTVCEKPWTDLFAYNMFIRPGLEQLEDFQPDWTIISAPGCRLDPARCGTRQENAAIISFRHKTILIAGSGYTGEIKKGIFTVLNYLLPVEHNVLSMHCSANMDDAGNTALFFGLSGTGKTTLSADPGRRLIGDDEHGWTDTGIFNFEGGCYAKCIDLSGEKEPEIFNAIRPGALVENTKFYEGTNQIDFSDKSITENTRVSYPIHYIGNAAIPSVGNIPRHIFFLTCDANGVLPPISRLSPVQAMYQFISGYTAKVAGTETGVIEPRSTFSACFGAPFLPLHPGKYAALLGEKMRRHQVRIWLVNTGWTGGPYGEGRRMKLSHTRAMITAALNGTLENAAIDVDPVFGFGIPRGCPQVPEEILNPRNTWKNTEAYDRRADDLARQFRDNFRQYAAGVTEEVLTAGPRIS